MARREAVCGQKKGHSSNQSNQPEAPTNPGWTQGESPDKSVSLCILDKYSIYIDGAFQPQSAKIFGQIGSFPQIMGET